MNDTVRIAFSLILFIVGLGFFASTVVVAEVARKSGEVFNPVVVWWLVAAGMTCIQCSFRLALAPRIMSIHTLLREIGVSAAAVLLLAGAFAFFYLVSDEKQSLGERILFAAVMPAAAWVCLAGWFALNIYTRKRPA